MKKTILFAAAFSVAGFAPALALEVTKSAEVAAPPEAVWKTIGEFCGIADWHPAVEKCELGDKGGKKTRTLSLKGGGSIFEELVSRDETKHDYTYKILESPLPVSDYKSTIGVAKDGKGSKVTWTGSFKAKGAPDEKATEVIGGIYEAGVKAIAEKSK